MLVELFRIPVTPRIAHQSVSVTLAGRQYRIELDWNVRIARWFVSIYSVEGEALLLCKGLRLGADVFRLSKYRDLLPDGVLTVSAPDQVFTEPNFYNLGVSHHLYFLEPEQ